MKKMLCFVLLGLGNLLGKASAVAHFFDSWLSAASQTQELTIAKSRISSEITPSLDPCVEAKIQTKVLSGFVDREAKLLETYRSVASECMLPTAAYAPECVAQLEGEEAHQSRSPLIWLANCSEKTKTKTSDQDPSANVSVEPAAACAFAQAKVRRHANYSAAFREVSYLMRQSAENCHAAPLQCIKGLPLCMDQTSIMYCFKQCLQNGNYDHIKDSFTLLAALEQDGNVRLLNR
ncbi:unnamed protein product [Amoebophrya sp. A25]|nr:unnamed protein product [Amoebophrya sp. A25]|eukprot:GSA25T00017790001.1